VKPPFTRPTDGAHDRLVALMHDFQTGPGFFAASLVAADDRFAHGVFNALEEDFNGGADLDRAFAGLINAEFLHGDPAFGLQSDIDDGEIFSIPTTMPLTT